MAKTIERQGSPKTPMLPRARGLISRVMAASFALCAFAVAIIAGMAAGLGPGAILGRALVAMIICYPVGYLAGMVCQKVVDEHIEQHERLQETDAAAAVASVPDDGASSSEVEEVLTV